MYMRSECREADARSVAILDGMGTGLVVAALALIAALPPAPEATFPGRNGLIAFHDDSECTQIRTIRLDGTGEKRLTPNSCDTDRNLPFLLSWMPDGQRLLLAKAGSDRLWVKAARREGRPKRLRANSLFPKVRGICRRLRRTANGSPSSAGARPPRAQVGEIWTARQDGSNQMKLSEGTVPRWSPDGSALAYIERVRSEGDADGGGHLSLMDARTGQHIRRLVVSVRPNADVTVEFDWAPDGKSLVFAASDKQDLYSVLTTGRGLRLTHHDARSAGGLRGVLAGWSIHPLRANT